MVTLAQSQDLFSKVISSFESWYHEGLKLLPHIIIAIIILIIAFFIGNKVKHKSKKILEKVFHNKTNSSQMIVNIVRHILFFFCLGLGVILAASVLGLDKLFFSAVTGSSFIGLALIYALKDVAADFFAGIVISLREPFKKGDMVIIADLRGYILATDLLFTTIRTPNNQVVYMPNNLIYQSKIVNFMSLKERRIILKTGVSYGDNLAKVEQVALDAIKVLPFVLPAKPLQLYFTEIGNSSYNFELRFWIKYENQIQYRAAKSACIIAIKEAFEKGCISIPYSVTTLDFNVKGGVNLFDKKIKTVPASDN